MGTMQAQEMAAAVDNGEITERQALVWHFRSNLFPPPPMAMVDVAIEAIHNIASEDADEEIRLPDGVTFRGHNLVLPWEVVEAFRLDAFLQPMDTVVPAPAPSMFEVVGTAVYDADTDTVWVPTHCSVVDGSDARLLSPGWNSNGWGTLENENGDRWRDESLDWDEYVTND